MSKIVWDRIEDRRYENGVDHGVLYPMDFMTGKYEKGVAWNGVTGITQKPDGADATAKYADNTKYLNLRAKEDFGVSITAFTYPDEFAECDGSAEVATGVTISQQTRKTFGLAYRTIIGSYSNPDAGYKLHLVYGCTASPSEKGYKTESNDPDAIEFSWDVKTVPVEVPNYKPTAHLEIDSTRTDAAKLKALEDKLFGTDDTEPTLLMPAEVIELLGTQG